MDDYELMLQLQQEDAMRDDVPEPGAPHVRMAAVTALYDQELEPAQPSAPSDPWAVERRESWLVQWRYNDPRMDDAWQDLATCRTRAEALAIMASQPLSGEFSKEVRIAHWLSYTTPVSLMPA